MAKKPTYIFLCDAKFSNSPKKLAIKLAEKLPNKRFVVRLKSRPKLPEAPHRHFIPWGQNINKLTQYQAYKTTNINHPEFTTDVNEAREWLAVGHTVLGRTLLNSFGGKGIIIFDENNPIPNNHNCRVFTKYKKKKHEYRVHVFNNQVIDFAQKKKRKEDNNNNNVNTKIRNSHNGWVYCRENVTLPDSIPALAIGALRALNLQYGAVDVIWNEHEQQAYVLEVNTSPGLSGSTVEVYANAFKNIIQQ